MEKHESYFLKHKNANATLIIKNNKYIVLKGSTAVLTNQASAPHYCIKLREKLINNGTLVNRGVGLLTFVEDTEFTSLTYAAITVVGGSVNGRVAWKRCE